jgi:glutathione synthase/RimK-type ligase-like ATP-grasp enzyme
MPNSERIFVDAVKRYCARHDILIEIRSQGWLIIMQRGSQRHFALGYDLGLNSAIAHRIANDKGATAEVLAISGIPCVPHRVFVNPKLGEHLAPSGSRQAMHELLEKKHPEGLVVKPNEGTSGRSVFRVSTKPGLERAVAEIFLSHLTLAISPYVEIEDEVRVVAIDEDPLVVYSKDRPCVVGDGKRSLRELALAATPAEQHATVLSAIAGDLERDDLEAILPPGERRVLNWRHNLDAGARPVLLEQGDVRAACVALARRAANAIGIRFASVDIVRVGGALKVLEINSGVMMEALGRLHPELVDAAYSAALDKVFGA